MKDYLNFLAYILGWTVLVGSTFIYLAVIIASLIRFAQWLERRFK